MMSAPAKCSGVWNVDVDLSGLIVAAATKRGTSVGDCFSVVVDVDGRCKCYPEFLRGDALRIERAHGL